MKTLQKIFGIGALALLSGCEPKLEVERLRDGYQTEQVKIAEAVQTPLLMKYTGEAKKLEGRIVKVQPSQFSIYRGDGNTARAVSHEFEYVIIEDKEGKPRTFIYPYSKAILEKPAMVKFRPLEIGGIDVESFIDAYIAGSILNWRETDDNFFIEAEGIIVKDGIQY